MSIKKIEIAFSGYNMVLRTYFINFFNLKPEESFSNNIFAFHLVIVIFQGGEKFLSNFKKFSALKQDEIHIEIKLSVR